MKSLRLALLLLFLPFLVVAQPSKADVYIKLAAKLVVGGYYRQALQQYDKAIKAAPTSDNYSLRGYCYDMMGDYQKGIADFDRAIELNNSNSVAFSNRGYAFYIIGKYEQSLSDYNRATVLKPDFVVVYSNRALLATRTGNYTLAISNINTALTLGMVNPSLYNLRGYCNTETQQYRAALLDYDQAIRMDSEYGDAYLNRGITKYIMLNFVEAYSDFTIAKQYRHPDADLWIKKFNKP